MPIFELMLPPRLFDQARDAPADPRGGAAWALISAWIDRVRQRKTLAGLDDHMLRDIGITRYDAVRECRKPFWK